MERYKLIWFDGAFEKTLAIQFAGKLNTTKEQRDSGKHFCFVRAYSSKVDPETHAKLNFTGFYRTTDPMTLDEAREFLVENHHKAANDCDIIGLWLQDAPINELYFKQPIELEIV